MKQFTLRVRPKQMGAYLDLYATYNGRSDSREASPLEVAGLWVPKKRYRVRYRLSVKGRLLVYYDSIYAPNGGAFMVCFLPPTWHGKRVTRTVLPWR